jgi:hypothetical protein
MKDILRPLFTGLGLLVLTVLWTVANAQTLPSVPQDRALHPDAAEPVQHDQRHGHSAARVRGSHSLQPRRAALP